MKALILAAGYGTRLYPLTKNMPKPLLTVGKQPMINHLVQKLTSLEGLTEIVVITNDKFFATFKDWQAQNDAALTKIPINIVNDGTTSPEDRLGAIGDIYFAIKEKHIAEDTLVIGGDNIFDFELNEFVQFAQSVRPRKSIGLVDIQKIADAQRFGVVALDADKKIISFEEKPREPKSSLVAMCLYYLPQEGLALISEYIEKCAKNHSEKDTSGTYIKWLYKKEDVFGFVFQGRWYDIGHIESYNEVQNYF
ncbi:nucleotidyltransferase family protein [Candidatus Omnitrophota bacterium]